MTFFPQKACHKANFAIKEIDSLKGMGYNLSVKKGCFSSFLEIIHL